MTDQIISGTSNLPTQPKHCPLTLAPYIFISIGHLKYLNTKWTRVTQAEKYPQFIANKIQAEYTQN